MGAGTSKPASDDKEKASPAYKKVQVVKGNVAIDELRQKYKGDPYAMWKEYGFEVTPPTWLEGLECGSKRIETLKTRFNHLMANYAYVYKREIEPILDAWVKHKQAVADSYNKAWDALDGKTTVQSNSFVVLPKGLQDKFLRVMLTDNNTYKNPYTEYSENSTTSDKPSTNNNFFDTLVKVDIKDTYVNPATPNLAQFHSRFVYMAHVIVLVRVIAMFNTALDTNSPDLHLEHFKDSLKKFADIDLGKLYTMVVGDSEIVPQTVRSECFSEFVYGSKETISKLLDKLEKIPGTSADKIKKTKDLHELFRKNTLAWTDPLRNSQASINKRNANMIKVFSESVVEKLRNNNKRLDVNDIEKNLRDSGNNQEFTINLGDGPPLRGGSAFTRSSIMSFV